MKVVLFCGGLGTRLREHSDTIPKPLVNIGYRPVLWHLMRYYAHFGHTDFVLALGYRGDLVREYFLNYEECMSNDFTLSGGKRTPARERLRGLAYHLRRYRAAFEHRPAPAPGAQVPRERRGVPRELLRRALRSAAR